jgi:hypothetical protein
MKTHQGFIGSGSISLLIGACLISSAALASDASSKHQEPAASDDQYLSTHTIASTAPASNSSETAAVKQQVYVGTLYRNGGYYGDQNSDVKLEKENR